MNIEPGIGIGAIQYGITEEELIALIGKPDRVDEEEYVEGTGDWHRTLWYSHRNLNFTFDKEDNYRLGTIAIMGSGYPLFGKELFGAPKKSVREIVSKATSETLLEEDHSLDEQEPQECLTSNALGILFWFDSDNLSEMQCGYLFESDNETVIWPQGHNESSKKDALTRASS